MVLTWGPDCDFIFLQYQLSYQDGKQMIGLFFGLELSSPLLQHLSQPHTGLSSELKLIRMLHQRWL